MFTLSTGNTGNPRKASRKINRFFGRGVDLSIAPVGAYNVHQNEGAHTDLTAALTAGTTSLTVRDSSGFAAGDICLVVQTQTGYGNDFASAGLHEELVIQSVDSSTGITVATPATRTYSSDSDGNKLNNVKAQLVKLVQYQDVDLSAGSLTGDAWDGFSGGLLAIAVNGALSGSGDISMNNKGFRGETVGAANKGEGISGAPGYNVSALGDGGGYGSSSLYAGCGGHKTAGEGAGSPGGAAYGYTDADAVNHLTFGGGGGSNSGGAPHSSGGGCVVARLRDHSSFTGVIRADQALTGNRWEGAGGRVHVASPSLISAARVSAVSFAGANSEGGAGYEIRYVHV